ncbi:MAG: M61 family metallopeptidase [Planctomycetes bacterium]|nr:M61 family metallopeptidase [Planctomycetota bacterium]MBT5120225.1 M61 family metallopeptidase [Planctomycetota bacterium]MBT7319010.1 M61 family metallopeptidase [Planctomycetota bacterium]
MIRVLLSLCALFSFCANPTLFAQDPQPMAAVSWEIRPDASGDFVHLEMRLPISKGAEQIELRMPYWKPGSYNFSNFEKKLSALTVSNLEGKVFVTESPDPRTWVISPGGARELIVRYQIETSNSARQTQMPAVHLHGPSTFLYTDETLLLPHSLRLSLPDGWSFASGHKQSAESANLVHSINYDEFVDCPMAFGDLESYEFYSHGKKFEVAFFGKMPSEKEFSREDWLSRLKMIVDAGYNLMGEFPFERYVFLYMIGNTRGGWGLEHLNSTTISFNDYFLRQGDLDGFESITSHEFFHLWNVKRIRPKQLGPFDYSTDVHTRDLWWLEGVTSYYQDVLLQRSGLRDNEKNWFWNTQIENLQTLRLSNGYRVLSPETTSWDIWKSKSNLHVSYYDQGQAIGLMLDILIRNHTQNERSLDDVVRFLNRWVNYPNPGYEPGDLERAIFSVTGWNPSSFFNRHIRGNEAFPFAEVLPLAGVDFFDFAAGSPRLGFTLDDSLLLTKVDTSLGDLRIGDQVLTVAGIDIAQKSDIRLAMNEVSAGELISIQVRRDGIEQDLDVELTVGERRRALLQAWPMTHPNALQKQIRESLLATD